MTKYIVYGLHNGNQVIRYVGRSVHGTNRLSDHRSTAKLGTSNMPVHKWMRKYGPENIEMVILEELNSENGLVDREDFWINELQTWVKDGGLNVANGIRGGVMGKQISEETREKMRGSARLRVQNETQEQYENRLNVLRDNLRPQLGSDNPMAKLNEDEVRAIFAALELGTPRREIADRFNTKLHNIHAIAEGKNWKHIREEILNGGQKRD